MSSDVSGSCHGNGGSGSTGEVDSKVGISLEEMGRGSRFPCPALGWGEKLGGCDKMCALLAAWDCLDPCMLFSAFNEQPHEAN